MAKGASFEREMCKRLSRWWTKGARDDVFWRSTQSGGRATQRAKSGKRTFGSYGDIAAVDPIGLPLLKVWTIELKRGRSHGSPCDLVDADSEVQRPFEKSLMQAFTSGMQAGSMSWLLICRKDRRVAMAYCPPGPWFEEGATSRAGVVRYDLLVRPAKGKPQRMRFVGMRLDAFLAHVLPDTVKRLAA